MKDSSAIPAAKTLGNYEIKNLLGREGEVYLANDRRLGRVSLSQKLNPRKRIFGG